MSGCEVSSQRTATVVACSEFGEGNLKEGWGAFTTTVVTGFSNAKRAFEGDLNTLEDWLLKSKSSMKGADMKRPIEAWFDGCCEPENPGGHAAYGALVKVNGEIKFSGGEYVGFGDGISNNVAEYSGVACVLREIAKYEGQAIVRGDSKLVIQQLSGRWKIHGGMYVPYYQAAMELLKPIKGRVIFEWIRRNFNQECDDLSKKVLRDRGVRFMIQPEGGYRRVPAVIDPRTTELDEDFKRAIGKADNTGLSPIQMVNRIMSK